MSTELDATLPAPEELTFLDTPQDILADPDDQFDLETAPQEPANLTTSDAADSLPDAPDLSALPDPLDAPMPDEEADMAAEVEPAEITDPSTPEMMETVIESDNADDTISESATLQDNQFDALSSAIAALDNRLDPVVDYAEQMRNSGGLATAATTFLRKLEILTASIAADHAKLSERLDMLFAQQNADAQSLSSDDPAGDDTTDPSASDLNALDAPTASGEHALPVDPEVPTLAPVSETAAPANAAAELASNDPLTNDATPLEASSTASEIDWSADAEDDAQTLPTQPAPANADESIGLDALPGAGEGLVWMLKKAGIESLSDLANADAEALGQQLGIVSDILDLTYWIDQAQERTANLTSNAA